MHPRPEDKQGRDTVAAGHTSTELYTHLSRPGWKPVRAFSKSTVSANQGFFFCPSVPRTDTRSHVTLTHTVMLTTTPSLPQNEWDPFSWQTNIFSRPTAIPRQMMDGQLRPDSPLSSQPITHKCLRESTWCISAPASVFSGATSKEPSGEQGGRERGKEREKVEGRSKEGAVKKTRGSKKGGREGGREPDAWARIYLSCQII